MLAKVHAYLHSAQCIHVLQQSNAPDIHFMVVLLKGLLKAKLALVMRMSSSQRAHDHVDGLKSN